MCLEEGSDRGNSICEEPKVGYVEVAFIKSSEAAITAPLSKITDVAGRRHYRSTCMAMFLGVSAQPQLP